jgi:hypothetical protein
VVTWNDLIGEGSIGRQFLLWGVAYRLAEAVMEPAMTALTQEIWAGAAEGSGGGLHRALDPAVVADAVVKGILSHGEGASVAALSGVNADDFSTLVYATGQPPDLTFLLEAYRRGYIPFKGTGPGVTTVEQGVRESHIRDEWLAVIDKMQFVPLGVADAVAAVVRGQIDYAAGEKAAYENGLDAANFRVLVNTTGRPPSPTELVELTRRGLIPLRGTGPDALTFQQGIYEGDTKDKWEPLYEKLTEYLPPPRTITTLQSHGVITHDEAVKLYTEQGLSPTLAAAYAASATATKVATEKQLTVSTVLDLYETQFLDAAQATSMLSDLGYSTTEGKYLLELTDFRRELSALNSMINRIGTYFIAHKLTKTAAIEALGQLEVPVAQRDQLIATWEVTRASNVRLLTESQIVDAWDYGIMSQDEAISELQALGYTARDAWVLLSNKNKAPLPNPPAAGPNPITGVP